VGEVSGEVGQIKRSKAGGREYYEEGTASHSRNYRHGHQHHLGTIQANLPSHNQTPHLPTHLQTHIFNPQNRPSVNKIYQALTQIEAQLARPSLRTPPQPATSIIATHHQQIPAENAQTARSNNPPLNHKIKETTRIKKQTFTNPNRRQITKAVIQEKAFGDRNYGEVREV
jgi:hypothetical protein